MRAHLPVGACLLLLALPLRAEPAEDLFARLGLTGHWAVSCAEAPSESNPHIHVATSSNAAATRRLVTGNAKIDNVLALTNPRLVSDNKITFQEFTEGKTVTFLVALEQGRYRIDEMVTSDGKALVTHAVQSWDGKPSPWYERCD